MTGNVRAPEPHSTLKSFRDAFTHDWSRVRLRTGLLSLPVIAACLVTGIVFHARAEAVIAAGGAFTVGFGAFRRVSQWLPAAMVFAALGAAISAWMGCVAGLSAWTLIPASGAWAAICALLTTLDAAAWWIVLQWAIAMFVAGYYPAGPGEAAARAGLVLAGGLTQAVALSALLRWWPEVDSRPEPWSWVRASIHFVDALTWRSALGRYALRACAAVMIATAIERGFELSNGYWAPMTAMLVLKATMRETSARTLQRVAGTLAGAALVTLVSHVVALPAAGVVGLVLLFAWASYALQFVNYAAFTTTVTAYVVLLLAIADAPELESAHHRILATSIGAGVSFCVDFLCFQAMQRVSALRA